MPRLVGYRFCGGFCQSEMYSTRPLYMKQSIRIDSFVDIVESCVKISMDISTEVCVPVLKGHHFYQKIVVFQVRWSVKTGSNALKCISDISMWQQCITIIAFVEYIRAGAGCSKRFSAPGLENSVKLSWMNGPLAMKLWCLKQARG